MGFRASFLVPAEATGNPYSLLDYTIPAGFCGPALHHHPAQESLLVVEGSVGVHLDGDEQVRGPGQAAHIAADEPHSFWNAGDGPARCVFVAGPRLEVMLTSCSQSSTPLRRCG